MKALSNDENSVVLGGVASDLELLVGNAALFLTKKLVILVGPVFAFLGTKVEQSFR